MKKTLLALAALVGVCACDNSGKFHIEGEIENAKDSMLYLEHIGIEEISVLDSVKLDEKGSFEFANKCGMGPEFYRLRIGGQIINVSIDSTETITIKSQMPNMASNYEIEGSKECQTIKDLALRQIELQDKAIKIQNASNLDFEQKNDSIQKLINTYKDYLKAEILLKNPQGASAYFALFQQIGSYLIFNPVSDANDVKFFAAVATSWDSYHPETPRTKNLHNIAIKGLQNTHKPVEKRIDIDADKIHEAGCIDIVLNDNKGNTRRLQQLAGKVVVLDFTVFADKNSPARIMKLRDIYNKYRAQGFEIYQVSLDTDEHFWKTSVNALPWICVHDENSVNSTYLNLYGVRTIPTFFVLDKTNTLKARVEDINKLDEEVAKVF